jgi:hypothetical protein
MQNDLINAGAKALAPTLYSSFKYLLFAGLLNKALAQQDVSKQLANDTSKFIIDLVNSTIGKSYYEKFSKAKTELDASLKTNGNKEDLLKPLREKLKEAEDNKDWFEKNVLASVQPLFMLVAALLVGGLGWKVVQNAETGKHEVIGKQGSVKIAFDANKIKDVIKPVYVDAIADVAKGGTTPLEVFTNAIQSSTQQAAVVGADSKLVTTDGESQ